MSTLFTSPEGKIVCADDHDRDLYFLIYGDCVVTFLDQNAKNIISKRLLSISDHFGEISLIYGCARTANVISRNYSIMSCITHLKFREVQQEFPEYFELLRKHIFSYKDPRKKFIYRCLKSVEYFRGISHEDFHWLLFNLQPRVIT